MPEGHTIHRTARDHARTLAGGPVRVTSPQGRFAAGAATLDGAFLRGIDAWGKHLFYRFEPDLTLHVHLGLYGKFWPWTPPPADTHRQVRLRLEGKAHGYDLTGPTACELLDPAAADAIVARLGPDPLRCDADGTTVWPRLARRRGPIGVALMDQSCVAGVGTVYRAEALWVHGIHPERPCATLSPEEWAGLWATLVTMLRAGLREGRIATVRPGDAVPDGRTRWVYKQERCARCGRTVRRWDLAGRWAYACETCQPPWPGPGPA
ncbi:MAG TPA: DNA-formamidopyrimidine glycosylase family protein [Acidimicrobiales bacterium]|nr:DNA-formamidopyrimidine glycosylase family protein [Acidimicrobiales bacterium]